LNMFLLTVSMHNITRLPLCFQLPDCPVSKLNPNNASTPTPASLPQANSRVRGGCSGSPSRLSARPGLATLALVFRVALLSTTRAPPKILRTSSPHAAAAAHKTNSSRDARILPRRPREVAVR
jgi:hypothetical protein